MCHFRLYTEVKELVHPSFVMPTGIMKSVIQSCATNHHISEIWNEARSSGRGYLATISSSGHRTDIFTLCSSEKDFANRISILESTRVESVEVKVVVHDDGSNNLEAVGVWSVNEITGCRKLICPENDGEILLCAGALGTPLILGNSIPQAVSVNADQEAPKSFNPLYSGGDLLDHTVLPLICIGKWRGHGDIILTPHSQYPPNSVHGWVFLDKEGYIYDEQRNTPPRYG